MDNSFVILTLLLFSFICYSQTLDCNDIISPDTQAAFKELGCYTKSDNTIVKKYYFPRYFKSYWIEARGICKAYNMELASFESIDEVNKVFNLFKVNYELSSISSFWMHVDGMTPSPGSKDNWYWTQTGRKISFSIPWQATSPSGGKEQCLSVGKHGPNLPWSFNDVPYEGYKDMFLCMKIRAKHECGSF